VELDRVPADKLVHNYSVQRLNASEKKKRELYDSLLQVNLLMLVCLCLKKYPKRVFTVGTITVSLIDPALERQRSNELEHQKWISPHDFIVTKATH
jgi:hypothetical protein